MEKIIKPRGTMDVMGSDVFAWNYIEKKVRDVADRFGFTEIKVPTFEEIGLFRRGVGETTDVVQKEIKASYKVGTPKIILGFCLFKVFLNEPASN